MTAVFPATAAGEHLSWYFAVRERGTATTEEIDAHFAPEYRWGWGSPREPDALETWFSRWRTLSARIERVEDLAPLEYVVTTRLDSGVVAKVWFELEDGPPHRIRRTRTTEHDPSEGTVDFGAASSFADGAGDIPPAFTTAVGPFGGYVAALAVRAAGSQGAKPLPLSLSGHFVNAGRSGPVHAEVETLRSSSRLESSAVRLRQGDLLVFSGHVWSGAPSEAAHSHCGVSPALRAAAADGPPDAGQAHGVLGETMEAGWLEVDGFDAAAWVRLQPTARFDDPWVDAARLLLPIDWLGVAAGVDPHRGQDGMVVASTLEIAASFFGHARPTDWVLCAAAAPVADGPWATATVTVVSAAGEVQAVAALQLLLRG